MVKEGLARVSVPLKDKIEGVDTMITLYSGTPGSGKSYHLAQVIRNTMRLANIPVLCNFPVNLDLIALSPIGRLDLRANKLRRNKKDVADMHKQRKMPDYVEFDTYKVTPEFFVQYARKNFKKNKENQGLIIIDECARIFNPRISRKDRIKWIDFFQIHRHLGYNIILVSQHSRLLDRQITYLLEYNVIHRNAKNYKLIGRILSLIAGGHLFIAIRKWHGVNEIESREFMLFRKSVAMIYDTFQDFSDKDGDNDGDEVEKDNKKSDDVKLLLVDNDTSNGSELPSAKS